MIYGLTYQHPQDAVSAVPVAALIGGVFSFSCESRTISIVKAVLAGIMVFAAVCYMPAYLTKDATWWEIARFVIIVGFFGGIGFGALLGGLFKSLRDASADDRHDG